MKYDLRKIMVKAWQLFRKLNLSFAECLHRSWLIIKAEPINRERVERAKSDAGITEPIHTWSQWRDLGYMVAHGSKCLFQAVLLYPSKGDGATYRTSFFGLSQVELI